MRTFATALLVWWAVFLAPLPGAAHPAVPTSAEATVEASGRFQVVAHFDTLAFALNDTSARIGNEPMEALLAGPRTELEARLAEAKGRFLHGFRVTTERGSGSVEDCEFPTADAVLAWKTTMQPVLPMELPVRLSGRLPIGAGTVAFRFPDVLDQVILTVERPEEEPFAGMIEAGASSGALPVRLTPVGAGSLPTSMDKPMLWGRCVWPLAAGIAVAAALWGSAASALIKIGGGLIKRRAARLCKGHAPTLQPGFSRKRRPDDLRRGKRYSGLWVDRRSAVPGVVESDTVVARISPPV